MIFNLLRAKRERTLSGQGCAPLERQIKIKSLLQMAVEILRAKRERTLSEQGCAPLERQIKKDIAYDF